ncbi:hypothetical protein, partial [Floridanema aerugineum]
MKETEQLGTLAALKNLKFLRDSNITVDLTPIINQLAVIEDKINQIYGTGSNIEGNPDLSTLNGRLSIIENRLTAITNYFNLTSSNPSNDLILTEGTVLSMLGSLTDQSGYSNVISATAGQQNPFQTVGIDNNPALSLITNQNELSIPNIPNLLTGNGATLYVVFGSFDGNGVQELVRTQPNGETWWRFSNGKGYFSVFRNSRLEEYPSAMPLNGNFLLSIHSRSNDYEIFINNASQGVVGGNYFKGDRFLICPKGKYNNCYLYLLLVVPFWVDKNSSYHQRKLNAI